MNDTITNEFEILELQSASTLECEIWDDIQIPDTISTMIKLVDWVITEIGSWAENDAIKSMLDNT